MTDTLANIFDTELKAKFGAEYTSLPTKADVVAKGFDTFAAMTADAKKRRQLMEDLNLPLPVAKWLYERVLEEKAKEKASSHIVRVVPSHTGFSRWGDDDLATYRAGYPSVRDNPSINDNWAFYSGTGRSRPNQLLISDFHTKKFGQYHFLEAEHGYIQWLFPIQEHGMNYESVPLQKHEIEKMRSDPSVVGRIVGSYKLMLDFYGMVLVDAATGEVGRNAGYVSRYQNLDWSSHNYLRITRILKCLGEMGLEHYKRPWLIFFIKEVYEKKEIPNVASSLDRYWLGTLKNDAERAEVRAYHDDMEKKNPLPKKTGYSMW